MTRLIKSGLSPARILALALALILALTLLPVTALAATNDTAISYLEYNLSTNSFDTKTIAIGGATQIESSASQTLTSGWYYVEGTVATTNLTVTGDAHLILMDGCTLTATANNPGIRVDNNGSNSLTVYAQSDGANMGSITATSSSAASAGIGGGYFDNGGAVTIHGGAVNATSGDGAGIGGGQDGKGGTVTIYGGAVNAASGDGAGIGGGVRGDGGTVTIYGGKVTAQSTNNGAGIGAGSGIVSVTYGTARIYGGSVTVSGDSSKNAAFEDANGNNLGQTPIFITVKVTDGGDDAPLQGVEVTTGVSPTYKSITDANGNATLLLPSTGEYEITFAKSGYATYTGTENISGNTSIPMDLDVAPEVVSVSPSGTNVSISTNKLVITFNEAMDEYTDGDVTLDNRATVSNPVWSNPVLVGEYEYPTTVTYDLAGLTYSTEYTVTIEDFEAIREVYMNPYTHTFTTAGTGTPGSTSYTVTYNANGGSGSHTVSNLSSGAKHTALTLEGAGISRDGYSFTGWNTKAGGSGEAYAPGDELTVSGDITLYARWARRSLDTDNHFAYIIGYPDGTVGPEKPVTRAETATIFFRLLTQDYRAAIWSAANGFSDVNSGEWYNNAVSTLANGGILNGYSDGSFNPNGSITRAELAAIAVRLAGTSEISAGGYSGSFNDISGHWAEDDIKLAAQLGYIQGYGDGSFRPDNYITRAEVVTLLNRVLNRHVESDGDMLPGMAVWADNTFGKWFYFDMQEAGSSHYYARKADGVYEKWTELRTAPDWSALEKAGAKPGDVSY